MTPIYSPYEAVLAETSLSRPRGLCWGWQLAAGPGPAPSTGRAATVRGAARSYTPQNPKLRGGTWMSRV